jgi:hypothetical protein
MKAMSTQQKTSQTHLGSWKAEESDGFILNMVHGFNRRPVVTWEKTQ